MHAAARMKHEKCARGPGASPFARRRTDETRRWSSSDYPSRAPTSTSSPPSRILVLVLVLARRLPRASSSSRARVGKGSAKARVEARMMRRMGRCARAWVVRETRCARGNRSRVRSDPSRARRSTTRKSRVNTSSWRARRARMGETRGDGCRWGTSCTREGRAWMTSCESDTGS